MNPEPRQARCPYCLEILAAEFVEPHFYRFPVHRGHARMLCAGRRLPIVENDYVAEEVAG